MCSPYGCGRNRLLPQLRQAHVRGLCAACSRRSLLRRLFGHDPRPGPPTAPAPPPAYAPPPAGFPPATPYATAPVAVAPRGVTQSSPGAAFLLGLVPGLGAIYNGQYNKGLIYIAVFASIIAGLSSDLDGGLIAMLAIFLAGFIFYCAFEAMRTAQAKNIGEVPADPLELLERRPPHRSDHSYRPRWPLAPEQFSSLRFHPYRASMAFDSDRRGTVHVPGQTERPLESARGDCKDEYSVSMHLRPLHHSRFHGPGRHHHHRHFVFAFRTSGAEPSPSATPFPCCSS